MNLSKLKASLTVAAMTLVSYSPLWAQVTVCDNPNNATCNSGGGGGGTDGGIGGGGGGTDGGIGGGGNGVPELDGPGVLMLVAIGIAVAVAIARRK